MDTISYLLGKKASGGSGGSIPDWTQIGYSSGTPQEIIDGFNYAKQIKDNWNKPKNMGSLYNADRKLMFYPDVDTSGIEYFNGCFTNCYSLIKVKAFDTSDGTDLGSLFNGCASLKEIPNFNTSKNTTMYTFAMNCYALEKVGNLDTSLVTNFYRAFYGDNSLTTIPVFDFSSATNLSDMFNGCTKLSNESIDNLLQSCITATAFTGTKKLTTLGFNNSRLPAAKVQACPHYQDFLDDGWTIGY